MRINNKFFPKAVVNSPILTNKVSGTIYVTSNNTNNTTLFQVRSPQGNSPSPSHHCHLQLYRSSTSLLGSNMCNCVSTIAPLSSQRRAVHTDGTSPVSRTSDIPAVIDVTRGNLDSVLKSTIPTILYFHVANNDAIAVYTRNITDAIVKANNEGKSSGTCEAKGEDRDISIRLAKIDCLKEVTIAQQFNVNPEEFPLVLFLWKQQIIDQFVGIPQEIQIRDMVQGFRKHCQQDKCKTENKVPAGLDSTMPSEGNNNNITSLIEMAQKKLQDKEFAEAQEIYDNASNIGRQKLKEAKLRLGLDKKKMTPELQEKLKQDPHYFALAQALAGMAMCHYSQNKLDEAKKICNLVRLEFPSAIRERRDVAQTIVRVDLLLFTDLDLAKDTYESLKKQVDNNADPVALYKCNIKLAALHLLEKRHKAAIDVCLSMIRTEPRLLRSLKDAGVVDSDATLSASNGTPARRIIFLIFEALGNSDEDVIAGRKRLGVYLSL